MWPGALSLFPAGIPLRIVGAGQPQRGGGPLRKYRLYGSLNYTRATPLVHSCISNAGLKLAGICSGYSIEVLILLSPTGITGIYIIVRRCHIMSMPKFPEPNPDFTQEQALIMILSSIALEEAALSHIINAEGEKIQHILDQTRCGDYTAFLSNIVEVNKSVTSLLEMVQQNQTILKNKMEKVLEYLPKPTCAPEPPCPPIPDCPVPHGMPACFCVVPKDYCCNEPLLWSGKNVCHGASTYPCESTKIQLPAAGPLLLCFYAVTGAAAVSPNALELVIACKGVNPIKIKIAPGQWPCHPGFFKQTLIEMPPCTSCYASVFVRTPQGLRIKQAGLFFTKFQTHVPGITEME